MSYASKQNIIDEFRGLEIALDTVITEEKILRWIEEAEAFIDSKLAGVYVVPITAAASIPILRMISTFFVSERIRKILDNGGRVVGEEVYPFNAMKAGNSLLSEYLPKEGAILPDIMLPSATTISISPVNSSVMASGSPVADRVFTKGGDNW